MKKLIYFELRKIFSKRLSMVTLIGILLFSALLSFSTYQNKYAFDQNAGEGSGKAAVEIDKEIAAKYEGILTDEKVRQMMSDFAPTSDLHGLNAAYIYQNAMQSAAFSRFSDLNGNWIHHAEHLRALVEGFHAHFEHDHHVDAAADQRQPHPLVLFGERLVVLARHHDPAVRAAYRDGDGFIRRALHHHAFHDGLPADILILMLLIAHCACSFPEALPQPRQGTEFPAPSKLSCGASLIRRPARRSAAFGAS